MSATDHTRINLRTSQEAKAMIERAATLMGTTVSAFMLQHAYEAASRVVTDNDTLLLSQQAFEAFINTCENSPARERSLTATHGRGVNPVRIELLAAAHNRKDFDCGEPELNAFLQQQAGQQQRKGLGKNVCCRR